jgi:large subunit ribosomal protein L7/L12
MKRKQNQQENNFIINIPGRTVDKKGKLIISAGALSFPKCCEGGLKSKNMADVKTLAENLVSLTVKEVQELADFLKSEYGIEPAAAAVVVSGGAEGGGAAAVEEKTAFNVVLKGGGASKLNVVKIVKEITGLGLKEAKDLVDGAPKNIKEGISKAEAEEIVNRLKEAGADVEIA